MVLISKKDTSVIISCSTAENFLKDESNRIFLEECGVEYGSIKEYYVKLRVYSSRMVDMLKQQTTSTVNVSDPPVMASNSTDSEGLVQLDPVRPNTTDSLPTDVYASTPSPVETQHELAKHYQEIHNLGEKEKGGKNKDG